MKKIIITASAISLFIFSSCTREEPVRVEPVGVVFTCISDDTKTAIEDGHTVWSLDDRIRVFYSDKSAVADLKTGEGTPHATFEAAVPETGEYYAVYPASLESALTGTDAIAVTIPATQNGSFASGHVAVAKAKDKTFSFVNVNGFFKFTVNSAKYTKITLESANGAALAGQLALTVGTDGVTAGECSGTAPLVEISTGGVLPAGNYYMSVLPSVKHEKGLVVKYYIGDSLAGTYLYENPVETTPSYIHSFGEFELSSEYFVAPSGTGSGTTKTNPMSVESLKQLLTVSDESLLSAKIAALDGTTVHLAAGVYNFDKILELGFSSSEVSITFVGEDDGNDHAVITGGDAHRILAVKPGMKLVFDNITFSNGRTSVSGEPAVLIDGGADVSFLNCRILDNVNIDSGGKYHTGAGITTKEGSTIVVNGCEFARNSASYGASLKIGGFATVKNCNFHNNLCSDGSGSSLYLDYEGSETITIENCTFRQNVNEYNSTKTGGAFGLHGGVATLVGCLFEDNSSQSWRGPAIYMWSGAKVILKDCTFKENHAKYGGAIVSLDSAQLEIEGGLFEDNYAFEGGGVMLLETDGLVKISNNARFTGNSVNKGNNSGHAGAINISKGTLECTDVTFEGNHNDQTKTYGGVVCNTGSATMNFTGCTFKDNYCDQRGGGAINAQGGVLNVSDCLFEGNHNVGNGSPSSGNTYGGGALRVTGDATITNSIFRGNYVKQFSAYNDTYGGAIQVYGGTSRISGCTFDGNYATRGGALFVNSSEAVAYLNACTFTGNYGSYRYGTTINIGNAREFCMNNCSIADDTYTTGGTSDWQAAWINIQASATCFSNCSFIGSPRYGDDAKVSTKKNTIIRYDKMTGDENYLVNNIIVTESPESSNRAVANFNTKVTMVYNKCGAIDANDAGGELVVVDSPTGNGFAAGESWFGNLQWVIGGNYWKWNGTLSGGNNLELCPSATAIEYIGRIAGFQTWLSSIGALDKDQLGNSRGNGSWWPGAYQNNQ